MAEPVSTIDDFLAVIRKSGLVDEARLEEACADWPDRSRPLPDELVRRLVETDVLTQWQADQLRKGKHRGFILGKYRLLRLLGAGGMSSVYLAEHQNLRGKVAIKVLPLKNADKTSYLARFEREAREAFRLSHHNIVRAFDLDTSGTIHYIVMEYVEGTDLHARVKRGGVLTIRDAVDCIRQAADGLQYAHEEGVVHRDIKPANLILDKRGTVKILDFGLALAGKGEDDGSLTQEHGEKVLGTADFLAPEQARDSHLADSRADIYALGCTLYYLLVGRVPFSGHRLADRIRAHATQPPPNPLDERPDVPPAIVELYFRMMEKNPAARPQTAKEVAETLGAWLGLVPGGNAGGGASQAALRPPPRRKSAGGGGGSVAAPSVLVPPASGIAPPPPGSAISPGSFVFAPASTSESGSGAGGISGGVSGTRSATSAVSGLGKPVVATPAGRRGGIGRPPPSAVDSSTASSAASGSRRPWSPGDWPRNWWIAAVVLVCILGGLAAWLGLSRPGARRGTTPAPVASATRDTSPRPRQPTAAKPAVQHPAEDEASPLDKLPPAP